MFITQSKMNNMKDRISNLEGQVEALTNDKVEERNKKFKEILNLDDKIETLEKDKRNLKNDVEDTKAKKIREEENIKHNVKIVMEKHDVELEKEKQKLEKEKNTEIALVKDKYRDKLEVQLEKRGTEMREMYNTVLERLTSVAGTLNKPAGVQQDGKSK